MTSLIGVAKRVGPPPGWADAGYGAQCTADGAWRAWAMLKGTVFWVYPALTAQDDALAVAQKAFLDLEAGRTS